MEILKHLDPNQIEQAQAEINHVCGTPKSAVGIFGCRVSEGVVQMGHYSVNSQSLAKHLAGAQYVGLLAATLGAQADVLIRRHSVADLQRGVVTDAVASVFVNDYCNRLCAELAEHPTVVHLQATRRFSPGYGDFCLTCQKDILAMLDADKRAGITLTDGYMLVPSKSITAVLGFV
jgi:cobalamin-dependent methionine synthase I